jgi:hypothetical protein
VVVAVPLFMVRPTTNYSTATTMFLR